MSARAPSALPADPIAALATPPGRSAIAVLRVSGAGAFDVARRVLEPWPLPARTARRCALRDPATGALVDRPLVTAYPGPRSYTGEDLVEIATHGGYVAPAAALAALLAAGAREALPGEFTRRAVLNGKLDVLQAEGVGDLIDARSAAMHRAALRQLDGGLSRRVLALRDGVIGLEALIAYDIDFPEEDDGPVPARRILAACAELLVALDALLATAPVGELVREGALAVLAGAPNVGKSSLFNALLGETRAIVTDVPGTTRDAIEAVVDSGGWPLRLVDTAGLRTTSDAVERLGVEVSERYLARAGVVLACGDSDDAVAAAVERVRAHTAAPVIAVRTKADLAPAADGAASAVRVSAETGEGLRELLAAIGSALSASHGEPALDVPMLTRARHERALRRAREEVAAFHDVWAAGELPVTVAAVHLRAATSELEELIGAVEVEEVLERVFATFCVGK